MAVTHFRARRKITGGRYKSASKKYCHVGGLPTHTKLGEKSSRVARTRGGSLKQRLLAFNVANVYDPKLKKCVLAKIETVYENSANRHFIRRNNLTKGTLIKTDKGNARITSRPGQEGTLNAILIA